MVNDQLYRAVTAILIDIQLIGQLDLTNAAVGPQGGIDIKGNPVDQRTAVQRFDHHFQMSLAHQPLLQQLKFAVKGGFRERLAPGPRFAQHLSGLQRKLLRLQRAI